MSLDVEARKRTAEQAKTHKELLGPEKTNNSVMDKNLVILSKGGN
jgi:hypothetical protein